MNQSKQWVWIKRIPVKRSLAVLFFLTTLLLSYKAMQRFGGGDLRAVFRLIGQIPVQTWMILIPLTTIFYALDWVRFRSVLGVLGHRLPPSYGMKLTGVSYFVTSLTPAAELHTPAMVYLLSLKGIPIPEALAASVTKSIYMTLWIYMTSYIGLAIDQSVPMPAVIRTALPVLTLPLLITTVFLGAVAFFPQPVTALTDRISAKWRDGSILKKLASGVEQCAQSISKIGKSGDLYHLTCHLASILFLLTYIVIGYILALHFGIPITFTRAITVFSTSLMIAYVSPIPGSIGITELTTSYMLDPALTTNGLAAALTLRILCWYLIAAPGGLILADIFRRNGRRKSFPKILSAASTPTHNS